MPEIENKNINLKMRPRKEILFLLDLKMENRYYNLYIVREQYNFTFAAILKIGDIATHFGACIHRCIDVGHNLWMYKTHTT